MPRVTKAIFSNLQLGAARPTEIKRRAHVCKWILAVDPDPDTFHLRNFVKLLIVTELFCRPHTLLNVYTFFLQLPGACEVSSLHNVTIFCTLIRTLANAKYSSIISLKMIFHLHVSFLL